MDDLEFQKRIYSNPADNDQDLVDYVKNNPDMDELQQAVRKFDRELGNILTSTPVPDGLQQKILALADAAEYVEHDHQDLPAQSGAVQSAPAEVQPAKDRNLRNWLQYYPMAAGLVVALGFVFSIFYFVSSPSANDLVVGTQALYHLHQEPHHLDVHDQQLDPQQFRQVLASAGGELNGNGGIRATDFNFINPCVLLPGYRSVHMVTQGKNGPINIFVIHNSPVKTQYDIADDDYQGVILPMADGNLILVGEKQENLNQYKDLFSDEFQWSI